MTQQVQTIVVLSTDSLEDLAFKINNWHRSALSLANESLNYAYQCGQALLEAKARVGHGGWLSWRDENSPGISERQTQRYMRVAQEWAAIEAAASDGPLTIDGALSLIATQRPNPTATSDLKSDDDNEAEVLSPLEADRTDPDEMPPLSQRPNPKATADLTSYEADAVNVPSLLELERTDPDEALPHESRTAAVVVEPVMRSQPPRLDDGELEVVNRTPTHEGTANEFKRLRQRLGEVVTTLSRMKVLGIALHKRVGNGDPFIRTLDVAHSDCERWGKLLREWSDSAAL